ncbi:aquaporin-like protein [Irpex rosettiformis]|uniref:Aquaporin-like protein n=1 Tax=Irpex rosettiformis TaxID=378272 RepID=A0ACB8UGC9_9APHY|nr:aquaporin-like protein [Irpex rosettiformis]
MATHSVPRRDFTHLADVMPRPPILSRWERVRHRQVHWLAECVAEATGVFLYVFAGVGATVPYTIGNILGEPGLSTLFTIGWAYALGIALAIIICSPTSGGNFNPAVTISFVLFRKMSKRKAARYIVAQILGGYIACLVVYLQYRHLILEAQALLASKGTLESTLFTPSGPAGIFALYVSPGSSLGQVFFSEFVCDFVLGLVIWASLDPTNFLVPPSASPWVIALTYAMTIWGFVPVGLSANTARDLGGRFMALTIWGRAASGGSYAAIAALTNIPATICAVLFYEFWLADSSRVVTPIHLDFLAGHEAHIEHGAQMSIMTSTDSSADNKGRIEMFERA